jgi:anti-sigma factor RsiW
MNYICEQITDLLPDLVAGTLSQATSNIVAQHLRTCAACESELALLHSLRAAAPAAPSELAERIARAVAAQPVVRRSHSVRDLAIAASIAITVIGGAIATQLQRDNATVVTPPIADTAAAVEAAGYLTVEGPALGAGSVIPELTEAQLEKLLAEMDS